LSVDRKDDKQQKSVSKRGKKPITSEAKNEDNITGAIKMSNQHENRWKPSNLERDHTD
jgi:hypothetical protein